MYGAFIGDIVGSIYEFNNIKTKNFPLFKASCDYTDDSIMTVAVARALTEAVEIGPLSEQELSGLFVKHMQAMGRAYPNPTGAYGGNFSYWLIEENPQPYGSFGNGSAMRVSPCGLIAASVEEAELLARVSAAVSHNHPEGIKGAQATAAAVYMAKTGSSKEEIKAYITGKYYKIGFTLDEIRPAYRFDGSCQGTVPQALEFFFESNSFEDAVRNVISIGGDTDTSGAICGSVAWAFYTRDGVDENNAALLKRAKEFLPREFIDAAEQFAALCAARNSVVPICLL